MAHTSEHSTLRFPAENCRNASRQTSVWPGVAGNGKGRESSLSSATKIGPPVEFSCVGLTVLSHERATCYPAAVFTTDAGNGNSLGAFVM